VPQTVQAPLQESVEFASPDQHVPGNIGHKQILKSIMDEQYKR